MISNHSPYDIEVRVMGKVYTGFMTDMTLHHGYPEMHYNSGLSARMYVHEHGHNRVSMDISFDIHAQEEFKDHESILIPEADIWTIQKHLKAIKEMQRPIQKELRKKKRSLAEILVI